MGDITKRLNMEKNSNGYYKKSVLQRILSFILIVVIVFGGLSLSKYLIKTKKVAKRKKPKKIFVNVEVTKGEKVDTNYIIKGFGRIYPAKEVSIVPEVSGKVVYVNQNLIEGGFIKKGETLIKIDDTDYKIRLNKELANLNSLKEDLILEKSKRNRALKELNSAKDFIKDIDNESLYVLKREPYIKKIEENIKIAEENIKQAKLDLERTVIKAPFNCYVLKKYIDVGGYVNSGVKIADIIDADMVYVRGNITKADLKYLDINKNINAVVYNDGEKIDAKLFKLEKALDEKGLLLKVILKIDSFNPNIFLYDYVTFDLIGKELKGIVRLPERVVREDEFVWIVKDNKLHLKKIKILFEDENYVYTYDIDENSQIIVTNLSSVVEGLPVKVINRVD
ncbi:RND efflux system, membrane fusion protein [Deferribacter desulfuricans SSM1]|uniref:RND efflux system, membrane fusion protein n=2 Tax=Deferribacter TaxID=53572 RepID=D3P9H0_DEFDS|nr:RND efflux system, membrane fusion protein [Deferribacter desulfuricans SSM1]